MGSPLDKGAPSQKRRARVGEVIVIVACLVLLVAMSIPVLQKARMASRQDQAYEYIRTVALGMLAYAEAHDGRLPDADNWPEAVRPYLLYPEALKFPRDRADQPVSYTMVERHSGARLDEIPNRDAAIILHESEYVAPATWSYGGLWVAYADGHARWFEEPPPGLGE
jgi:hypothetical protein